MTEPVNPRRKSLLIIDDDIDLCELMADYFSQHGFYLHSAHDGQSGLALALTGNYDLVILDVMLPVITGFELLRQLRTRSTVPVIMLTARTEQQDRITGLNAGADDYLPKPFGPDELLARINAVLRRGGLAAPRSSGAFNIAGIRLHPDTREGFVGEDNLDLTSVEFQIIDLLARSAGRVVSRDELSTVLYQRLATPYERALDVHVSHLRKKLSPSGIAIQTVRGVGYTLVPKEA